MKTLKNEKSKNAFKNEKSKCLTIASTAALQHNEIPVYPERINNFQLVQKLCNWKEINFNTNYHGLS